MTSKLRTIAGVAALVVTVSVSGFAGKTEKKGPAKHVAIGTISSISSDQVVVNEKVKGKEKPMTFQMDSSTQKSGNLANGALVTIQYHTEKNQNIANSIRERSKTNK